MENKPNTIWIKAYTPAGTQVGITVAFEDGKLTPASDLDAMIASAGYSVTLPGAEPGEDVDTMTHVLKRIHTNKDDGSKTPVLAFYHENAKLKHKFDHVYMNTPEEIAEFERLSGLTLASIPEWMGDNYIARDHEKASQFVIALPNPIKVASVKKEYEAFGNKGLTSKIQRFIGATPANVTTLDTGQQGNGNKSNQRPGWLSNKSATTQVKERLAFLGLDNGEEVVSKARSVVDLNMNSFQTPEAYLTAIEEMIQRVSA